MDISVNSLKILQLKETGQVTKVGLLEDFAILDPNLCSYSKFFEEFLMRNKPCLFSRGLMDHWAASAKWTLRCQDQGDDVKDINFDYLCQRFGQTQVCVSKCVPVVDVDAPEECQLQNTSTPTINNLNQNEYGDEEKVEMTLEGFIAYWRDYRDKNYQVCDTNPFILYLKDWHIAKESKIADNEQEQDVYENPKYFTSDWLNEGWSCVNDDDFKFAYLGPKGTWTPFHADVFGSFSWSANIIGQKLWRIYPKGKEAELFLNKLNGRIEYNTKSPGIVNQDFYEIVQKEGEIIFIPSNWFHVVRNLTDTISINHNWFNGANILEIWTTLKNALQDVKNELEDIIQDKDDEEYHIQCQLILKANHGMNYLNFCHLIEKIQLNRIRETSVGSMNTNHNHIQFDLLAIKLVVVEISQDPDYQSLIAIKYQGIEQTLRNLNDNI